MFVIGRVRNDEFAQRLSVSADELMDLTEARARAAARLRIEVDGAGDVIRLREALNPYRVTNGHASQGCRIVISYSNGAGTWMLRCPRSGVCDLRIVWRPISQCSRGCGARITTTCDGSPVLIEPHLRARLACTNPGLQALPILAVRAAIVFRVPEVIHVGRQPAVFEPHARLDQTCCEVRVLEPPSLKTFIEAVDSFDVGAKRAEVASSKALPAAPVCVTTPTAASAMRLHD